MSKYTTQVRFICENYAGLSSSVGETNANEVINKSWDKVFNFDFPIFDEDYRPVLCKKIIKHYYTREIGFETVGLWKLKLDALMNEIMPYYNQLYDSTLLEWNPLYDADYRKTHEGSNQGSGNDVSSGKHTGTVGDVGTRDTTINDEVSETTWDVYSDTPQGALTNVENNTYLTNARKVSHDLESERDIDEDTTNVRTYNEKTDNELNREYSNTDEYLEHVQGKFPGRSYASLIKEYRETFLNIDLDIIGKVSELFLNLW